VLTTSSTCCGHVVPAVKHHRPAQDERWRVLRAQYVQDGVLNFVLLFDGGPTEDWELQSLLDEALGPSGAEDALRQMGDLLKGDQVGWSLAPVRLDVP